MRLNSGVQRCMPVRTLDTKQNLSSWCHSCRTLYVGSLQLLLHRKRSLGVAFNSCYRTNILMSDSVENCEFMCTKWIILLTPVDVFVLWYYNSWWLNVCIKILWRVSKLLLFSLISENNVVSWCYSQCAVVGLSNRLCLSVTFVSPANRAEPIEMPLGGGMLGRVGQMNHHRHNNVHF